MVTHPGMDEATQRDIERVRRELFDRFARLRAEHFEDALRWLGNEGRADAVNEALDAIGAPA